MYSLASDWYLQGFFAFADALCASMSSCAAMRSFYNALVADLVEAMEKRCHSEFMDTELEACELEYTAKRQRLSDRDVQLATEQKRCHSHAHAAWRTGTLPRSTAARFDHAATRAYWVASIKLCEQPANASIVYDGGRLGEPAKNTCLFGLDLGGGVRRGMWLPPQVALFCRLAPSEITMYFPPSLRRRPPRPHDVKRIVWGRCGQYVPCIYPAT